MLGWMRRLAVVWLVALALVASPAAAEHVATSEIRYACGAGSGPDDCGIDPVGGGEAVGSEGEPTFGEAWIDGDEEVVGIVVDGEARAYPLKMLSSHEVVNDRFDGRPITVTYCPLCGSSVAYERNTTIDGTEHTLDFTASGYLYKQDLVMWDPQTGTLWNQILAQAIGTLREGDVGADHPDVELPTVPSTITTWDDWRSEHPESPMLQPVRGSYRDPYEGYYESCRIGVSGGSQCDVDGLHPKAQIVGIDDDGTVKAWVVPGIHTAGGVVVDEVDGRHLVVSGTGGPTVYDAGDRRFEKDGNRWVDQDGQEWDLERGVRADGGAELVEIPAVVSFWFAWQEMHPDTALWTGGETGPDRELLPGLGTVAVIGALATGLAWAAVRRSGRRRQG